MPSSLQAAVPTDWRLRGEVSVFASLADNTLIGRHTPTAAVLSAEDKQRIADAVKEGALYRDRKSVV